MSDTITTRQDLVATEDIDPESLWFGATDVVAHDRDWSTGWTEKWEYKVACECGENYSEEGCGRIYVPSGPSFICDNDDCELFDVEQDAGEGPMMSYWYPLPENWTGEAPDPAKIMDLPLCLVEVVDEGEEGSVWDASAATTTGLALTGGGMDLSWEICEAFIRLGWLPPTKFADLPEMGGRGRSARDRVIIAACRRAFQGDIDAAQRGIERLKRHG